MKVRSLWVVACAFAMLFSSCSREEPVAPQEEEKVVVSFNVRTLSHDIVPMASVGSGRETFTAASSEKKLSDAFTYLFYAFFNENGTRILQRSIINESPNFGKFEEVLTKGKYKVMVWGCASYIYTPPWSYDDDTRLYTANLTDDIFFDQFDLVVSDVNIDQQVRLKRKVGNLQVEITDKVPENISEIRYSIDGVSDWFAPKTNRADNRLLFTRTIHFSPDGSHYYEFGDAPGFYFFLDRDQETKVTVKLVALDLNKRIVAERTITDVPVNVNRKTKVRGRLFENSGSMTGQAFSFELNSNTFHYE
jgi:hypothetical protein